MRISDWSSDVCSSDLLENDTLEDIGGVDLVFDVIGGDIQKRPAGLVRAGGTLVSIVGPAEARPVDGLAVDFVVVPDSAQLSEVARRGRDGPMRTDIGHAPTLDRRGESRVGKEWVRTLKARCGPEHGKQKKRQ